VLLPGPPGVVLGVNQAGELFEESLPKALLVRQLLNAGGGRALALLEDGTVVARDSTGTWTAAFSVPATTASLLALPDGRILGGGRLGQLGAWSIGGENLGQGSLPEPSPVSLLAVWNGLLFAGGSGGRLYSAPLGD
jgi:hypothetical protein